MKFLIPCFAVYFFVFSVFANDPDRIESDTSMPEEIRQELKALNIELDGAKGATPQSGSARTPADALTAGPSVTTTSPTDFKKAKETEIPLSIIESKKATSAEGSWLKLLLAFSIVGSVSTGLYFFLKRRSRNSSGAGKSTQITVLGQHHLGPKKSLVLIRVAGETMLIGATDTHINLVKALSLLDEEVPVETPQNFKGLLAQNNFVADVTEAANTENEDEYTISGIKEVVARKLKNLRPI